MQSFFTDRLLQQRQASPHTIASYRDTIRLLLGFLQSRTGKPPSRLDWSDLDAEAIAAFLDDLETSRHNGARTRNLRLTAIRSLFAYASLRHPEHADLIARVLAIPPKRFDKANIAFLDDTEVAALLAAPDRARWEGRRDRTLILLAIQTGLRVSELLGLNRGDITLGASAHLRCRGKGRKERAVPLTGPVEAALRLWLTERGGLPDDPVFCTRTGRRLSPDAVQRRLALHAQAAAARLPLPDRPQAQPARPAPHQRDGTPARRRRHHRDRALARPRRRPLHQRLPARRPRHQGTRPRQGPTDLDAQRPLPTTRPTSRLPRKPVTMPTRSQAASPPALPQPSDPEAPTE